MVRVEGSAKAFISDDAECVGKHRDLQGMLGEVLIGRVSHQGPAVYPF